MRIPLTPVLCYITTVKIEVYLQCFIELVSLKELGKSTSRAEKSSPNSLYFTVVNRTQLGSALTVATSQALSK